MNKSCNNLRSSFHCNCTRSIQIDQICMHELRAGSADGKLHVFIISCIVCRTARVRIGSFLDFDSQTRTKIIKIYDVRRSHTAYGIPESSAVPFLSVNLNMQSSWRLTIFNRIQSIGVNATCMILIIFTSGLSNVLTARRRYTYAMLGAAMRLHISTVLSSLST